MVQSELHFSDTANSVISLRTIPAFVPGHLPYTNIHLPVIDLFGFNLDLQKTLQNIDMGPRMLR